MFHYEPTIMTSKQPPPPSKSSSFCCLKLQDFSQIQKAPLRLVGNEVRELLTITKLPSRLVVQNRRLPGDGQQIRSRYYT
ncbi:hypothetical protein HanHA300_Chr11g0391361 [Helianthus annuus]|nr:hypothetical protein HanHA300_Chr11g0391361 [Helianthus annuus]KAJ0516492.1 hypothetical protein HanHA89_Chr11g0414451 [Helianthus annuus]KAJ0684495.1 hypothetical protein HanLR1_Chr11g0391801 [Helianthus annuus]KAJ0688433.1 hypothetical protein HanOQP8_Chr11g0394261 [Helianthus annuus]